MFKFNKIPGFLQDKMELKDGIDWLMMDFSEEWMDFLMKSMNKGTSQSLKEFTKEAEKVRQKHVDALVQYVGRKYGK